MANEKLTGRAVARSEDAKLITGQGQYLDDLPLPDCAVLMFFRSPFACGEITELDVSDARAGEGVLAVYVADDLAAAGIKPVLASDVRGNDKHPGHAALKQSVLAHGAVRYVGEPVAAVVATSKAAARDAIELIGFDVSEHEPVADLRDALAGTGGPVHADIADNVLGVMEHGDAATTDALFADAAHVIDIDLVNNRLAPNAIEPRGCAATYDQGSGEMTLYQGCQGVHALRNYVCKSYPIDADKLHVVSPDVGGGFGLKMFLQCETMSVMHAAQSLGRPVKWVAERSESFLADLHARDHLTQAALALDADGTMRALRVTINSNVGAYQSQGGASIAWFGAFMSTGCYRIEACHARVNLMLTNTVPVDAYRGAGRPEAAYLIERLVDKAARSLGMSPAQIRRRNFITADAFPYEVPTGQVYDSGDYARVMDVCLERADWRGFDARRRDSEARGMLRGIGLSYYVEICSSYGAEHPHIEFRQDGQLVAFVGTQSTGQGHETSFAQLLADALSLPMERISVRQGDTRIIPTGEGTGGSRSLAIAGSALTLSVTAMLEQGKTLAASVWQVDSDAVDYANGQFSCGEQRVALDDIVARSFDAPLPDGVVRGLRAGESFAPKGGTFPNGCHICEVEVDPDTGATTIQRYTVQDDMGNVVNPLLLQGQIMGGIAQGLGQAMLEQAIYEPGSGQLLTGSFLDYAMPYASDMPDISFAVTPVPSPRNPLGVKGAGEAGTVGAPPAFVNSVVDALYDSGVEHLDMPLSPMAVWQALASRSQTDKKREAA
ncbi:MAG: xanthine dehydrogenase family protein molybdopterin-binding subunit [Pseudomonadota bacterium]